MTDGLDPERIWQNLPNPDSTPSEPEPCRTIYPSTVSDRDGDLGFRVEGLRLVSLIYP